MTFDCLSVNTYMNEGTYSNNPIIQTINNNNPLKQIKDTEFDNILLKFGSLVSILKNKRLNQTMFLIELLEKETLRECFKLLSGIEETSTLFYNIIVRYPILCKSKIVKTKIAELNANSKRTRII